MKSIFSPRVARAFACLGGTVDFPNHVSAKHPVCLIMTILTALTQSSSAAPAGTAQEIITQREPAQMYEKKGDVRFKPAAGAETTSALPQPVGFDEGLRTLSLSGAALRLTDLSHLRLRERTRLEIIRQPNATNAPLLKLDDGEAYMINRDRLGIPVQTPNARGV